MGKLCVECWLAIIGVAGRLCYCGAANVRSQLMPCDLRLTTNAEKRAASILVVSLLFPHPLQPLQAKHYCADLSGFTLMAVFCL